MVDYNAPLYVYPQEIWDAKKCAKMAKHVHRDGCGTKLHFKGFIGSSSTIGGYGITRYNGGTEVDGKWYQGIERPLPQVAEGYEIVVKPTWGWQIIKKETP